MSIQALFHRIAGFRRKAAAAVTYGDIFKGNAGIPPGAATSNNSYLPGLRQLEYDGGANFKEAFGGPLF